MVPLGVSQGAATRVGNLIGAGDTQGMRRAVKAALLLGTGVMVVPALAFLLLRFRLPALYSSDPEVIALAALLLPIAATFQLCDGTQVVAGAVLRGMGRPDAGAVPSVLGYYALALPLAYVLGFVSRQGLVGIWAGLAVGLTVVAIALVSLVRVESRRPLDRLRVDTVRTRSTYPPTPALDAAETPGAF
jgi:MATE family multidrug resistance protein